MAKRKIKIAVVTGTRAEYYLLKPLIQKLLSVREFDTKLLVTGAHLSKSHGYTYKAIVQDKFPIFANIKILSQDDSARGIAASIGKCVQGFAEAYHRMKPDLVILLGDRYETLAAAEAALVTQIPMAHIYGGDITVGAYDDAIRHSISKMAHIHFVTNPVSEKRLRQLGENPHTIFNVGALAMDCMRSVELLERRELEKSIPFHFQKQNILVTYHKETLSPLGGEAQITMLLRALGNEKFRELGMLFTYPNADNEGTKIRKQIDQFVAVHPHATVVESLGHQRYFSVIRQMHAVVGNSSSGVLEVPFFKVPTVNIGNRQKGRFTPASVLTVPLDAAAITRALSKAIAMREGKKIIGFKNPYGNGDTANRIVKILLREKPWVRASLSKEFFDLV